MIRDVERNALCLVRDAGIAGGAVNLVGQWTCGDLPRKRVLASAGTEQ
jgi:hypothetical protein